MRSLVTKGFLVLGFALIIASTLSVLLGMLSMVMYNDGRTPNPNVSSVVLGYNRAQYCYYNEWDLHGISNEGLTNGAWGCDAPFIQQATWAKEMGLPDNTFTREIANCPFWPLESMYLLLFGLLMLSAPTWLFGKEYMDNWFPTHK